MKHYSENRNPDYKANKDKWQWAWDHYTGEYVDDDKITDYLFQKMQREGNKAFISRKKDPDPILHFPTAVDSINGILSSNDLKREWGELGDPEDGGSIAHSLIRNADGNGTNWEPLFKQIGIKQTVLHTVWGLVEGVELDNEGNTISEACIKVIKPQAVVDWYPRVGNPTSVMVKEQRGVRDSIKESGELKDVYTVYELDGWRRFIVRTEKNDGGEAVYVEEELGSGEYEYYASSKKRVRVLPIFRVQLPLPRHVGYLLAKKQNHMFNFKSLRDHGAANLSLAILKIKATPEQYDSIINSLMNGGNTMREEPDTSGQGHQFMSPDGSYLSEAGEILQKDVEQFYYNAFKEFGDVARQATATEIIQMSATGIEAFLNLLVSSLDEFENQCFLRLLQVYLPNKPDTWGSAYVERSTDFTPKDIDEQFLKMTEAVRNADQSGSISLHTAVSKLHPNWTEDEIEDEVERINSERGTSIPDPFQNDI